jgi:phosphatidylinositol alpha-mannosyltransferase
MKVGLVLDDSLDKPDGVQQFVLIVGKWLSSQGHDVHYLVGQTDRTDLANVHSLSRNVKVRFNQNRMAMPLPASLSKIKELLAREKFDVLHVQVPYSPALAGRIIKAADPKTAIVGTFHVLPHSRMVEIANHVLGNWVRAEGSLIRFDSMMATSAPAAEFAKRTFKVDASVVPLPIEIERFKGAKPFSKYKSGRTVVYLGRLVERKGCLHLLRAVDLAQRQNKWPSDVRVVVCSAGPLEAELKKFAADNNLDNVEFTGFISEAEKPRYLASADVVVYPSTGGESFGIVLLEAMAASSGMVLAGNNPGYASVMAPRPQSLFDPKDTTGFSQKLVDALNNSGARRDAAAWQQKYVKNFDTASVGQQIVKVYKQAILDNN